MYLSRLILNPRHRQVQEDLADCQALHRTIMSGFPDLAGTDGARAELGVLYRLERGGRGGLPVLLVQSREAPDWSRLPAGYLAALPDQDNPTSKMIAPAFDAIREGMLLRFRLRANPTRKIDTKSGPDGRRRNGRRVELRRDDQLEDWLRRKAEASGFRVLSARNRAETPNARVVAEGKIKGRRNSARGPATMTFAAILFDGALEVTDAALFRRALEQGIGPGKAYGFGLLSVAPLRGEGQ